MNFDYESQKIILFYKNNIPGLRPIFICFIFLLDNRTFFNLVSSWLAGSASQRKLFPNNKYFLIILIKQLYFNVYISLLIKNKRNSILNMKFVSVLSNSKYFLSKYCFIMSSSLFSLQLNRYGVSLFCFFPFRNLIFVKRILIIFHLVDQVFKFNIQAVYFLYLINSYV